MINCPCFQCICIPVCKQRSTFNLLEKCFPAAEFCLDEIPGLKLYPKFMIIKRCLGLDDDLVALHEDWQDLVNRSSDELNELTER